MKRVTVIGAAIVDVVAGPIGKNILQETGSMPMDDIRMTYGGNGHNEAVTLSRLGVATSIITKVGDDETGRRLLEHMENEGIDTSGSIIEENLKTGINVVLFDEKGERRFLTDPNGSLRKLSEEDVFKSAEFFGDIVSFSGMFVSPMIDIEATERIFKKIKEDPAKILVVDMVKPKKGEKISDIKKLLPYIDYFLPNAEELRLLSEVRDEVDDAAHQLIKLGVEHVLVKEGKDGCRIFDKSGCRCVEAVDGVNVVDTTGAGDSFVAGFIYGLCNDMSIEECAGFANAVASCCVEAVGATEGILSVDEPMKRFNKIK